MFRYLKRTKVDFALADLINPSFFGILSAPASPLGVHLPRVMTRMVLDSFN